MGEGGTGFTIWGDLAIDLSQVAELPEAVQQALLAATEKNANIRLVLDDGQAKAQVASLNKEIDALGHTTARPQIDVKATAARSEVKTLTADMSQLSRAVATPRVELDGFEATRAKFASLHAQLDVLSAQTGGGGLAVSGGVAAGATKGGFMGGMLGGGLLGVGAIGAVAMAPQIARMVYSGTVVPSLQKATLTAATARTFGGSAEFNDAAKRLQEQTGFLAADFQMAAIMGKSLVDSYGMQRSQLEQLLPLAADYAATSPIKGLQTVAGSFEAISGAIRGEAKSAQDLGLTLSDTYMQTQAANGAFRDTWSTLTDAQQAQARYTEALKQSQDLMGKAEDKDSVPNKIRSMNASLSDLALKIGTEAAPAVASLAEAITRLVNSIPPWMLSAAGWVIRNAPKSAEIGIETNPMVGPAVRLIRGASDIYQGESAKRAAAAAGKEVIGAAEAVRNISITINDQTSGGIKVPYADSGSFAPSAH